MSEKEIPITATSQRSTRKTVQEKFADATLRLVEDHGDSVGPLTPEGEKKLRRKLYLRIMLLLSAINIMLFVSQAHSKQLILSLTVRR